MRSVPCHLQLALTHYVYLHIKMLVFFLEENENERLRRVKEEQLEGIRSL